MPARADFYNGYANSLTPADKGKRLVFYLSHFIIVYLFVLDTQKEH